MKLFQLDSWNSKHFSKIDKTLGFYEYNRKMLRKLFSKYNKTNLVFHAMSSSGLTILQEINRKPNKSFLYKKKTIQLCHREYYLNALKVYPTIIINILFVWRVIFQWKLGKKNRLIFLWPKINNKYLLFQTISYLI